MCRGLMIRATFSEKTLTDGKEAIVHKKIMLKKSLFDKIISLLILKFRFLLLPSTYSIFKKLVTFSMISCFFRLMTRWPKGPWNPSNNTVLQLMVLLL